MSLPLSSGCLQEPCQKGSILAIEEVPPPGKQATNAHRMLRYLVAAHGAIALLDPPADGTLGDIVSAIKGFPVGSFPFAITRQARPEVPAIQKQEAQAIGQTLMLAFVGRRGFQIAPMHGLQFGGLLALSTPDQF